MIIWTHAVLDVLYACVLYFYICTCSAQLSMLHMERHSRISLIIIIITINSSCPVLHWITHTVQSWAVECARRSRDLLRDPKMVRSGFYILSGSKDTIAVWVCREMKFQPFYVHYLQKQGLDIDHVYRKLRVKLVQGLQAEVTVTSQPVSGPEWVKDSKVAVWVLI